MNRKFLKIIGLLIIGLLLISACGLGTIKGSGDVITESREVSGFDSVSRTGIGRVIITQGDKESLTIEADDNLMEHITSEVKNGTLELGFTDNVRFDPTPSITFTVGVKDIAELDSSGTASIEIDELSVDNLKISISGTGSVSIETLTATDLVVNAEGTGDIALAGTVVKQDLELRGTGDYEAPDLESRTATVRIDGTSKAQLWVLEALDVVINGAGEVSYFGSPNVTQSITGTSRLTSLGDK